MKNESKLSILWAIVVTIVLLALIFHVADIVRASVNRYHARVERENRTFPFLINYRVVSNDTNDLIPSIIQINVNGTDYHSRLDNSIAGESKEPFTVKVNVYGAGGISEFLKSIEHRVDGHTVEHYDIIIESTNKSMEEQPIQPPRD
ncbi:hypothetical protein DDZ13_14950 [Coraliomargarita sinensis]|uniref:Uncharacterized protein n=1 Tax=Coraliomargarita sinensis TaxID=2174842 RepID=A0A317ZCK3_9BACT|nr:hypothetical protein [Coraliomargarita sinensis]PXA02866.1 hypothetical protein DDZ13_14950 [Coraliomargarita sinensis]